MRKSQKKEQAFKGGITALLTLVFLLMLSLVGALVESVSVQMEKNRNRADTMLALESAFAEYDRGMLEQYDLFVRHGCSESTLENRLGYYGATNMSHSIQKHERLTDNGGAIFQQQAVCYAKNRVGLDASVDYMDYGVFSENYFKEEEMVYQNMQELLSQNQAELPTEGNPLSAVQTLKNMNFINLVCENPEQLSNRSIVRDGLPSVRQLEIGNWGKVPNEDNSDKVFLALYLMEHFDCFVGTKESKSLLYEQEYLIGGYASDRENLENVCKQILSIRMIANYGYLLTDSVKQAEAQTLALTLCSLLVVPGITEVVKHALLFAWAYGESVVDVRVLLKGKKVPVMKSGENWQLQLANLATLGTDEEEVNELDTSGGLGYQSYLTGLLIMKNKEVLSMRSFDLIESNLHIQTDECMTKVEIKSKAVLRRGIKDSFTTSFGYQ